MARASEALEAAHEGPRLLAREHRAPRGHTGSRAVLGLPAGADRPVEPRAHLVAAEEEAESRARAAPRARSLGRLERVRRRAVGAVAGRADVAIDGRRLEARGAVERLGRSIVGEAEIARDRGLDR